ncbi:16S rRNA (cytosine(1402)-N(4))-methyltransferase RsmH [Patescibacteria group bacterium]
MKETIFHQPVMLQEVIDALHIKKGFYYIDATLGTGGHALEIIKAGGRLLGIERDPKILSVARKRLFKACPTPKLILGNFVDIDQIANDANMAQVNGVVFDLGVNNLHLTDTERGFSFKNTNAPLDMRLDPDSQNVTAADLLNVLDITQLGNLFSKTMKYPDARELAKRIVEDRPILTVADLNNIAFSLPYKRKLNRLTLPMLALRMAVNSELENLKEALPKAFKLLGKTGKLIVISFHSAEDAIVKDFFGGRGELILPNKMEINKNLYARSAKMRVLTKI